MSELEKLLSFIPEKWRPIVVLSALLSPYVTRAIYALRNNGGLRGVVYSIWLGTNTPKANRVDTAPVMASDTYNPKQS